MISRGRGITPNSGGPATRTRSKSRTRRTSEPVSDKEKEQLEDANNVDSDPMQIEIRRAREGLNQIQISNSESSAAIASDRNSLNNYNVKADIQALINQVQSLITNIPNMIERIVVDRLSTFHTPNPRGVNEIHPPSNNPSITGNRNTNFNDSNVSLQLNSQRQVPSIATPSCSYVPPVNIVPTQNSQRSTSYEMPQLPTSSSQKNTNSQSNELPTCNNLYQNNTPNVQPIIHRNSFNDWNLKYDGSMSIERFLSSVDVLRVAHDMSWEIVSKNFTVYYKAQL